MEEIEVLDKTSSELENQIKEQCQVYKSLKYDIDYMKKEKHDDEEKIKIPPLEEKIINEQSYYEYTTSDSLEDEIDYYYTNILNIGNNSDFLKEIAINLPRKSNVNFDSIIRGIKMKLIQDTNETNRIIVEDQKYLEKEDYEYLYDELQSNYKKIQCIDLVCQNDDILDNQSETKNNIFYITNSSGTPRALIDIDTIDQELYYQFYELFKSIEDGTFKGVGRFTSNNNLKGYSKLKWYKARIIFDRIGPNDYVILGVFKKNFTNAHSYTNAVSVRIGGYEKQKEHLIKNLKNKAFRDSQEKITEQIFETLNNKKVSNGVKK